MCVTTQCAESSHTDLCTHMFPKRHLNKFKPIVEFGVHFSQYIICLLGTIFEWFQEVSVNTNRILVLFHFNSSKMGSL